MHFRNRTRCGPSARSPPSAAKRYRNDKQPVAEKGRVMDPTRTLPRTTRVHDPPATKALGSGLFYEFSFLACARWRDGSSRPNGSSKFGNG